GARGAPRRVRELEGPRPARAADARPRVRAGVPLGADGQGRTDRRVGRGGPRRADPGVPRGRRTARGDAPRRRGRPRLRRPRHAARGRGGGRPWSRVVRRELPGGYELDDDPARLDLDAIWDFLSTEAYWGRYRSRDVLERQVRDAARTIGLYQGGRQVGFARVVSDGRIAYLADVYVLREHRGRGAGAERLRARVERRWLLHTRDAHGLYEGFGFGPPSERVFRTAAGRRARMTRRQAGAST